MSAVIINKKFRLLNTEYNAIRYWEEYPSEKVSKFKQKHNLAAFENMEKKIPTSKWNDIDKYDVAIMFSGGLDSLSLALRHLEKGETVALLSLCFNKEEQIATYLSAEILKNMYPRKVGFYCILGPIYLNGTECSDGLSQQPVAAFLASFMNQAVRETAKTLEIAYCMNDDALSYLSELKTIYDTAIKFRLSDHKYPKLTFPLTKIKHAENLEYIRGVEEKHHVMFPTFSSEGVSVDVFKKKDTTVFIIKCDHNLPNKENKQCEICGYIFMMKKKCLT